MTGAWELLSTALAALGSQLLFNPDPNVGPGDWAELNPDTLVSTGLIRAALAVAGGQDTDSRSRARRATLELIGLQVGTGTDDLRRLAPVGAG